MKIYSEKTYGPLIQGHFCDMLEECLVENGWVAVSDARFTLTLRSIHNAEISLSEQTTGASVARLQVVAHTQKLSEFPLLECPRTVSFNSAATNWNLICDSERFYFVDSTRLYYFGPLTRSGSHILISNGKGVSQETVFSSSSLTSRVAVLDESAEGFHGFSTPCYLKIDPRVSQRSSKNTELGVLDIYQIWTIQKNDRICGILPGVFRIGDSSIQEDTLIRLSSGKSLLPKNVHFNLLGFEIDG